MQALIISGGRVDVESTLTYLERKRYDRIIVADSGLDHAEKLGIMPTDILGDFDSLEDKDFLEACREKGIPVHTFPSRKDYTDTHLALLYAKDIEASSVTIIGATGSRYDHSLANIGLLGWLADQNIDGKIVDKHNEIEMLKGPAEKEYKKDSSWPFFSLLAWGGEVTGVTLKGFSYPLEDGTLTTDISLGISNEITSETARVSLRSGYLLVVRSSD
jgi:thiamine pyrophosphokinase